MARRKWIGFLVAIAAGAMVAWAIREMRADPYAFAADASLAWEERVERLERTASRRLLGQDLGEGTLRATLDSLGRALSRRLGSPPSKVRPSDPAAFLFEDLKIEPLVQPARLDDHLPGHVLQRRQGGCVALSFLFVALGARTGTPFQLILAPGHILVGAADGRLVEPLRRGIERSPSFYREHFQLDRRPWYDLAPRGADALIAALAVDIGNAEWAQGHLDAARSAFVAAAALAPGFPEAEGNLGLVLEAIGDLDGARSHLAVALRGDSLAIRASARLAALVEAPGSDRR